MKFILTIGVLIIGISCSFSQWNPKQKIDLSRNNIGVNLLGEGSFISLAYERNFSISENQFINAHLGVGYNQELCFLWCGEPTRYLTIPHRITYNVGKRKHFFEIGFGGVGILEHQLDQYAVFPTMGYRFQGSHFFLRTYACYIMTSSDITPIPFGISLGGSF